MTHYGAWEVEGYAKELEKFDEKLGILLEKLKQEDLLILTADHGNDPTYSGTDHTREYVPFLAYSPKMQRVENWKRGIHLQ